MLMEPNRGNALGGNALGIGWEGDPLSGGGRTAGRELQQTVIPNLDIIVS
jgi:hypothetical protein